MKRPLPRLHAVTNDEVLALPDFLDRATRIADAPVSAVHLRTGSLGGRALTDLAETTLSACDAAKVFVNDRADIALAVGAGGLHLPATGLPLPFARSMLGPDVWIGRSAHSSHEVARAVDEGADYVFLGPIWPTPSHPGNSPLGPSALTLPYDIPIIAIGGVTAERVPECLDAGAYGVAAISALWHAQDVASAARCLSLSFPL